LGKIFGVEEARVIFQEGLPEHKRPKLGICEPRKIRDASNNWRCEDFGKSITSKFEKAEIFIDQV